MKYYNDYYLRTSMQGGRPALLAKRAFYKLFWLFVLCFFFCVKVARADLNIEITQGRDNAVPIAIVPFLWQGSTPLPQDVGKIVEDDLYRSGQFKPLSRDNMLSLPAKAEEVAFDDWRRLKVEYLVIGQIVAENPSQHRYKIRYELFDVIRQRSLMHGTVMGNTSQLRDLGHYIANQVYENITGVRGVFLTKILYVTTLFHNARHIDYALNYADADGKRVMQILKSQEPIMSPAWAPDGKRISYVSFEGRKPSIYVQNLATGQRQKIASFKGLNSAPAWSPDGKKMAMVFSFDGTPQIYVMDLASRKLTQITHDFSINTSPAWGENGESIFFTSNRSGGPQIFEKNLRTGKVRRVTFKGHYNARAKLFDRGQALVMVQKDAGGPSAFHITVQSLKNSRVYVLTPNTRLDDAPSVSPNGMMVLYATRPEGGERQLAIVSIDGRVQLKLPSSVGSVSEPAWSPYLYGKVGK